MKRSILLAILFVVLICGQGSSQTSRFGPKVGADLSTWYNSGISNTQWRFGFLAGIAWDVDFENNFHFVPEVLFIQKGAAQVTNNASGNIKDQWTMNYIEVPLMGKFDLENKKGNRPFFTLGATASYFIGGNYKKKQDGTEVANGDVENLDRKYDFGAAAGAGMDLGNWIFEFRGQVGFVAMINASTARNATLSVNFTYLLGAGDDKETKDEKDRFDDKF